jgi:nitroreductase
LESLFEAARWAASSNNEQPWRYIVGVKGENPEQFDRLASTLVPANAWAKDAPVLILSVAKTRFSQNNNPNRVALHDVGMATENLVLQALSEGIYVHQMGGFDVGKAREVFAIPEGFEPVAMIALGYPGDPGKLDEKLKARELADRTRKTIEEFVIRGKWGGEA